MCDCNVSLVTGMPDFIGPQEKVQDAGVDKAVGVLYKARVYADSIDGWSAEKLLSQLRFLPKLKQKFLSSQPALQH